MDWMMMLAICDLLKRYSLLLCSVHKRGVCTSAGIIIHADYYCCYYYYYYYYYLLMTLLCTRCTTSCASQA